MKKVLAVLKCLGGWLLGTIVFWAIAWWFLVSATKGAPPTPELAAQKAGWAFWSAIIAISLGWHVFLMLQAIYMFFKTPPPTSATVNVLATALTLGITAGLAARKPEVVDTRCPGDCPNCETEPCICHAEPDWPRPDWPI